MQDDLSVINDDFRIERGLAVGATGRPLNQALILRLQTKILDSILRTIRANFLMEDQSPSE
jgi:hypothetical protein